MFVTLSVAAMLSMAATSEADLDQAQASFESCIVDATIENLGKKTAQGEFSNLVKTSCEMQSNAFYTAIVNYERSEGATQAEAEEFAAEEVQMMIENSIIDYAAHLEANTLPVKES